MSTTGGDNGTYTNHHHHQLYNSSSKNYSSTNELHRHQKLPHIGGVQLNSIFD
jgi:hypothetical protein